MKYFSAFVMLVLGGCRSEDSVHSKEDRSAINELVNTSAVEDTCIITVDDIYKAAAALIMDQQLQMDMRFSSKAASFGNDAYQLCGMIIDSTECISMNEDGLITFRNLSIIKCLTQEDAAFMHEQEGFRSSLPGISKGWDSSHIAEASTGTTCRYRFLHRTSRKF
jgi:hypothetical protein